MIYYLLAIWVKLFSYFPCLVVFAGGDPLTGLFDFIKLMICLSSMSVCFRCTASFLRSAVIFCSLAVECIVAAYSFASDSDSSSPSM